MNLEKKQFAKMDFQVAEVLGNKAMQGFQKSYLVAEAIVNLKGLLTKEYMSPIMALQGNRLGFLSDKDKEGGYGTDVVRNCLIEAVLIGVEPVGNQFNIIAGNAYITKEGFGHLLKNTKGLSYSIVPELPRVKDTSSAIVMNVEWTYNGVTKSKSLELAIKVNKFMGVDAIIGKATRKARAWLFNTINNTEIADGEIQDIEVEILSEKGEVSEEKENKANDALKGALNSINTKL